MRVRDAFLYLVNTGFFTPDSLVRFLVVFAGCMSGVLIVHGIKRLFG